MPRGTKGANVINIDPREVAARAYAVERRGAHAYRIEQCVTHLAAVRSVLADLNVAGDLAVAAWLHDVIEETGATRREVSNRFGESVATLVWAVSSIGPTRRRRLGAVYSKIRAHPPAASLKIADRIAMVEAAQEQPASMKLYRSEHAEFAEALAGLGDPRLWERLAATISG